MKTAFLLGDLMDIFMKILPGMETDKDKRLILKEGISGLVQSPGHFYEKLVEVFKRWCVTRIQVDSCLWIKISSNRFG
jgi:hypothetical protein